MGTYQPACQHYCNEYATSCYMEYCEYKVFCMTTVGTCQSFTNIGIPECNLRAKQDLLTLLKFQKFSSLSQARTKPVNQK